MLDRWMSLTGQPWFGRGAGNPSTPVSRRLLKNRARKRSRVASKVIIREALENDVERVRLHPSLLESLFRSPSL